MAYHPLNLALRFVLELAALAAFASFGWQLADGVAFQWLGAITLPVVAAALWGVFAVPGDPSRSGGAPVPVPGWFRLTLEVGFFSAAALAIHAANTPTLAVAFAAVTALHYAASGRRIRWLLTGQ